MKKRSKPVAQRSPGLISRKKAARAAAPQVRSGPMRVDPTRTLTLRKAFARALKKAFGKIKTKLYKLIVLDDAFGLKPPAHDPFTADKVRWTDPGKTIPTANAEDQPRDEQGRFASFGGTAVRYGGTSVKDTGTHLGVHLKSAREMEIPGHGKVDMPGPAAFVEAHREKGQLTLVKAHADEELRSKGIPRYLLAHISRHALAEGLPVRTTGVFSGAGKQMMDKLVRDKLATQLPGGDYELHREALVHHYERLPSRPTANTRWAFTSDADKLSQFTDWLRTQLEEDVLGDLTDPDDLWRKFIEQGFTKGAGRAFDDTKAAARGAMKGQELAPDQLHRQALVPPLGLSSYYSGRRDEFLRAAFGQPVARETLELLVSRTFSDLEGVTDAMGSAMTRTLADGLVRGASPEEVARDLMGNADGIGIARANTIARTEIIRAHAEGQLVAMEQLGVEEVGVAVEWNTAGDDKVCAECEPLQGIVMKLAEAKGMLPRHPNAVFASSTFASYGECEELVRAWYSGPAVVLVVGGRRDRTTIGPNHPVLTRRGMVPAAELREGDEVLYDRRCDRVGRGLDGEQIPTVQNVYEASLAILGNSGVVASASDLHGDVMFCEGEVQSIRPTGRLLLVLDSGGVEQLRELDLTGADSQLPILTGSGTSFPDGQSILLPPPSRMSRRHLDRALLDGHTSPLSRLSLRASSQPNPSALQSARNCLPSGAVVLSDGARGFTVQVTPHDHFVWQTIHRVSFTNYTGWAFDATTATSIYCSDGLVVSNCRCAWIPANVGEDEEDSKRTQEAIEAAMSESEGADGEGGYAPEAKTGGSWGPGVPIAAGRPRSTLNEAEPSLLDLLVGMEHARSLIVHGGPGSGNFGHGGRSGEVGGSAEGGAGPAFGPHAKVHEGLARYPHGVAVTKLAGELKLSQKATRAGLDALVSGGHADDLGGGLYGPKRASIPVLRSERSEVAGANARATPGTARAGAPGGSAARGPATPLSGAAHAPAVARAYLSLRERNRDGYGLVDIADLAKETGKSVHETLAGVNHLRQTGALSASKYEGRGTLKPHQLAVREAQGDTFDSVGLVSAKDESHLHRLAANAWQPLSGPVIHGGPGSGNFGHGGRPGEVGGSAGEGGASSSAGPSKPEERYGTETASAPKPPSLPWKAPPPKKGKRGEGMPARPTGDASQTKIGDLGEALATAIGFRSILPPGQRSHRPGEVAEKGSTIDLEYDHSGRGYELKLCNTTATEYRLKAKASEKEAKLEYARQNNLTAHVLVGVRDVDTGEVHFYAGKEPGLIGAEVSSKHYDYVGTVKV